MFPALDVVAQTAPSVTAVEITSTPAADANSDGTPETYGTDETIRVQLTFSAAVEVTVTPAKPRLRIDLTSSQEWAEYSSGSGTTALTFSLLVQPSDLAPAGIAVLQNTLQLNGGKIVAQADRSINANLAHAGLAKDPDHKVDGRLDTAAPNPQSATVFGRTLAVIFSEFLDTGSTPAGSAFTVTATPEGGMARSISGTGTAAVVGGTATVTLAGSVVPGEALTVAYAKPASGPLRDAAENEVANFSGQEATNITPQGPAYTLVRNTGQKVETGYVPFNGDVAQPFTTGSQTGGYRLTSAEIYLRNAGTSAVSYSVKILNATSGGAPGGTALGTLQNPAALAGGRNTFTAAGEGIQLAASTTYFVVFDADGTGTNFNWFDYELDQASSDDEDPGAASGWSIGDAGYSRSGTTWTLLGFHNQPAQQRYSALIAVHGHEARSKTLVANTGQSSAASSTNASFSNDHAQPFDTGSNSGGYRVTAVQIETAVGSPGNATAPTYEVSIRADSSGDPGTSEGTLTNPSALAQGVSTFTASGPGIKLDDSETYFLLMDVSAAGNQGVNVKRTTTNAEDSGAATGWSIGDDYQRRGNSATDWTSATDDANEMKIAVRGHGIGPDFESAEVDGTQLAVTFAENLGASSTPGTAFDIIATKSDGTARGIGGTGSATISGAKATVTLTQRVDPDETLTLRYTPPVAGALGDGSGDWVDAFSGEQASNARSGRPYVTAAAITSTPKTDADSDGTAETYGSGEKIQVRLTFNAAVAVTDTPRLKIRLAQDSAEKWADYESGDGTTQLTFAYTVGTADVSTSGIAVLQDTLELNGGTMVAQADSTLNAVLPHAGLAHDPGHKVNGNLAVPFVAAVAITSTPLIDAEGGDGTPETYGAGETIRVQLTFGAAVAVTGTPRLKIRLAQNSGEKWADYASGTGTTALTFAYTVVSADVSTAGIAVLQNTLELNGGTMVAQADGTVNAILTHVGRAHDPGHKVNGSRTAPTVSAVTIVSTPSVDTDSDDTPDTYGSGETIRVRLTFNVAVAVTGTPRLQIDLSSTDGDEKWAEYAGGSGTTALTFAYKVASADTSTAGIAVLQNTLQLNGGTMVAQADSTLNAVLTHAGLAHDPTHKVDGSRTPPLVTAVAITSTPSGDANSDGTPETYGLGEEIKIQLTFSEAVVVTGEPRLRIDVTSRRRWAVYDSGSGTTALTFIHSVTTGDLAPAGLAVLRDTLELNGGTIVEQAVSSLNAILEHSGLAKDPDHKVDGRLDNVAPVAQSAEVRGRTLAVIFSEFLDAGSQPAGSAFTVTATPASGTARSIVGTGTAAVVGGTATVTLASSVAPGEAVAVAYAKPASGPLRDPSENETADFSGQEATNVTPQGPGYTLVRNTAQSVTNEFSFLNGDLAQPFTTGGQAGGYRLTSAEIWFRYAGDSAVSYSVSIVNAATGGGPGSTTLGTLENPAALAGGRNTFTAPGEGIQLAASTTYFLVFDTLTGGVNWRHYAADQTPSDDEDPGAASGWSIGDAGYSRSGTTWTLLGFHNQPAQQRYSALIAVHGHEERAKTLVANTGQTSAASSTNASFSNDHAQPFTTGSHDGGYRVTAVQVGTDIGTASNSTEPTYEVSIRADSSGDPGTSMGTLAGSAALAAGTNTFAASGAGIKLDDQTKYFLQLDVSAAGDRDVKVQRTATNGEDAGAAAGWSIGDTYRRKGNSATSWSNDTSEVKIAVRGHGVGPAFQSARVVDQKWLEVTFDGNLGASTTPGWAFDIIATAGGVARGIGGTGNAAISGATATVALALEVAADETLTVSYTPPAVGALKGGSGNWVDAFSGQSASQATEGLPFVSAVSITSTPASDTNADGTPDSYGLGETILIGLSYSHAVAVTGTPRLKIAMARNSGERWAEYVAGISGTAGLMFAYTVASGDISTAGIAVLESTLELNGGTLVAQADSSVNAILTHAGRANDPGHKVSHLFAETIPPTLRMAEVSRRTLAVGFSEYLDRGSAPPGSAFTVTATPPGASARTIRGTGVASISGGTATVTLAGSVAPGEAVTVQYAKSASGPLRDGRGNEARGFTGLQADNSTPSGPRLVGNTGQRSVAFNPLAPYDNSVAEFGAHLSQAFTTGSSTHGYRLSSVEIHMARSFPTTLRYSASILNAEASGEPGSTVVGRLTGPAALAAGLNTFKAAGGPIRLEASTTYCVVLTPHFITISNFRDIAISLTLSDAEDGGGTAGFSIADGRWVRAFVTNPWERVVATGSAWKMAVNGAEDRSTKLISNTGQTASASSSDASFSNDHAQWIRTGSHSAGYRLTRVQLGTSISTPANSTDPTYSVGIWDLNASAGTPGTTSLGTLANPAALATAGLNTFAAAGPGIKLAASTSYALALDVSAAGNKGVQIQRTNTNSVDSGAAAGWSTGQQSVRRANSATAWSELGQDNNELKFAIYGHGVGPGFQSATVNGTQLVVTFGANLGTAATVSGALFDVTATPPGGTARGIGGTGNVSISGAKATVTLASAVASDEQVTLSYSPPAAGALGDASGNWSDPFSDQPVTNGKAVTPGVSTVAIASTPSLDSNSDGRTDTYGVTETIEVRVTFSAAVTVTGTPRLQIDLTTASGGEKWAGYSRGSGSKSLTFAYTVAAADVSTAGVAVLQNTLELNGGKIVAYANSSINATLAHAGLGHDTGHKVNGALQPRDTTPPRAADAAVRGRTLAVVFDEDLDSGSAPPGSAFTVRATARNGSARTIGGAGAAVITDRTATVTLAGSVTHEDRVAVRYAKPASGPVVRDVHANETADFFLPAGTNNTPPGPGYRLVSNARQSADGTHGFGNGKLAQPFTTGSRAGGYLLTGAEVVLATAGTAAVTYAVSILDATQADTPGSTSLGTLTNPSGLQVGLNRFTFYGTGIELAADTTYFVVLEASGANTGDYAVSTTGSDAEDPDGAAGWSMGNESYINTGTAWVQSAADSAGLTHSARIAVSGHAARAAVLVSNAGQTTAASSSDAAFSNDHGQPFGTGTNSGGYRVTEVDVGTAIRSPSGSTAPSYTVSIRSSSSGNPGASLEDLSPPDELAAGANTFFVASGPGTKLASGTEYFVLVDVSAAGDKEVHVQRTDTDGEDAGAAAGWSIGNGYRRRGNAATAWTSGSDDANEVKITVRGYGLGPGIQSAQVEGDQLVVNFDGNLGQNTVAGRAFDVIATRADGTARGIGGTGSVTIANDTEAGPATVTVALAQAVAANEGVRLRYTPPATDALWDGGDSWVDGFSGWPVLNRQADGTPPGVTPGLPPGQRPGTPRERRVRIQPKPAQLALWTDRPAYRAGESVRLYRTLDPDKEDGRYRTFVYLERAGAEEGEGGEEGEEAEEGEERSYVFPLSAAAELHADPVNDRGMPEELSKAWALDAVDRELTFEGPAPEPGLWQFVIELRPGEPDEQVRGFEEPLQTRRAWAKFVVAERGQLLNRRGFTREVRDELTLTADAIYYLQHQLFVRDGATLTIEPGTFLQAWGPQTAIIVEPGGQIVAEGTREAPVVLTCSEPVGQRRPGCWGGLRLLGRAPVTRLEGIVPGVLPAERAVYGGRDAEDSSGVLRYVRVEFAGAAAEPETTAPAIGLYGAGSSTVLDHVQARSSGGDGFAFAGGNAGCSHCVASGSGGSGLSWERGWRGDASHVYVQHGREGGDGISGTHDAEGHDREPRSMPTVSNVTLVHAAPYGRHERSAVAVRLSTGSAIQGYDLLATGFRGGAIRATGRSLLLFHDRESSVHGALLWLNGAPQVPRGLADAVEFSVLNPELRDVRDFANPDPRPKPALAVLNYVFDVRATDREGYIGAFHWDENWLDEWTVFGPESLYDLRERDDEGN